MIGQTISNFKITEKLGEGGMGTVYKARDLKLDRIVALKFLSHSCTPDEDAQQRFKREAKAAASLNHPNICTIHNIFEYEDGSFIVMEYVDGETLRTIINNGEISLIKGLKYALTIAKVLVEAHHKEIIHRDLKPENIMVDSSGRLKVMDFGLAKLKHAANITKTGDTVGTVAYMSPEQIRGKQVDHRSDLFSLGILLYEMITGVKPFRGEHEAAMIYSIVNEAPTPIQEYAPEAPEKLEQCLLQMLAKEPVNRVDSATEAKNLLEDVLQMESVVPPHSSASEDQKQGNTNRWTDFSANGSLGNLAKVLIGGIGILLLALIAGSWFLSGDVFKNNDRNLPAEKTIEVSEHSVAVLPFEVSGSAAEEWKDGMVTTLSLNIDGAGGLRSIADRTIFAAWRKLGNSDDLATGEALEISREVGAEYGILGSAVQLGDDLRFSADIRETATGKRIGQVEVRGSPDSLMTLADDLTRKILGILLQRSDDAMPSVDLASITTESLPALKKFLEGERHLRSGETSASIENFEAAIQLDSTFALPYARLALLGLWHHIGQGQFVKKAHEFSDELPQRNRKLIEALYMGRFRHRTMAAAEQFRQLTRDYPDDPSVWNSLGEFVAHADIPGGVMEVENAHRRAVRLDPGNTSYYDHYIDPAFTMIRDSTLALQRIEAMPQVSWTGIYRHNLKLVFGSDEQQKRALTRLDTLTIPEPWLAYGVLMGPEDRILLDKVLRKLLNRSDISNETYSRILVWNDFRGGRISQALTDSKRYDEDINKILAWALSLDIPVPDDVAYQHLDPENLPQTVTIDELKYSAIYLIEQDRSDDFDKMINRLTRMGNSTDKQKSYAYRVEATVQELKGYRAWKSGNLQKAKKLMNRSNETSYTGAIWRGNLYRQLGEFEKAEGWYLAAWVEPIAHKQLGRMYEQWNKEDKASPAYMRFIEAWDEAEPELRTIVKEAQKHYKRVSTEE